MELIEIINIVLQNSDKDCIEKLNDSDKLVQDLKFDSLMLAELTVRIEDSVGIDVYETGNIETIKDIKDKLNVL